MKITYHRLNTPRKKKLHTLTFRKLIGEILEKDRIVPPCASDFKQYYRAGLH